MPTRISKWKGVDSFIDLVNLLDDDNYHALIVGPQPNQKTYLKQLQNKISNYGIEDKITITGSRNDISIFIKFLILFLIYLLNLSHLGEQQSKQLVWQ